MCGLNGERTNCPHRIPIQPAEAEYPKNDIRASADAAKTRTASWKSGAIRKWPSDRRAPLNSQSDAKPWRRLRRRRHRHRLRRRRPVVAPSFTSFSSRWFFCSAPMDSSSPRFGLWNSWPKNWHVIHHLAFRLPIWPTFVFSRKFTIPVIIYVYIIRLIMN